MKNQIAKTILQNKNAGRKFMPSDFKITIKPQQSILIEQNQELRNKCIHLWESNFYKGAETIQG